MVDKTSFAISSDPVRVFLTGVYFKKKGDSSVSMVATDGRKLAYIEKNMEKEIPDFPSAIIPDKFFKNLKLISNDNSSVFSLAVTNSHIFARVGSRFMYTALINGNYPNYQKVIPSKFNYSFIVKTKEFENSLSLNSVLIDSKSRRIFIDVASEGVMITGDSNEYGESKQLIKCEYDGPEIKISFNSGIIAPAVKKVDGEFMRVSFNSATQAVKLSPDPEKDYLFVVMPLQS